MAWADSRIFRAFVTDVLANTTAMDLSGTGVDTFKNALFNNSVTPDRDATAANSAYNAGTWLVANEITSGAQWPATGVAIGSPALTNPSTGVVMFDAVDTASSAGATLTGFFGCLVYDDTIATPVADQGVCFLYLGGTQTVTNGTATIVYDANGLFRVTV
jgi:hypothetical protein